MAFLKNATKNATATSINTMIASADQSINNLKALKSQILQIRATIAANTTDFSAQDLAELDAEINRLGTGIAGI